MLFTSIAPKSGGASFSDLGNYFASRDRNYITLPLSEISVDEATGELITRGGNFPMTRHAAQTFSRKLGIPAKYMENTPNENAAANFNFYLPTAQGNTKLVVETLDNNPIVMGFLPERYEPVPIDIMVEELESAAHGLEVKGWTQDEQGLTVRLVSPKFTTEPQVGDLVYAGLDFINYENDGTGLDVRGAIYRLVCMNGAVIPDISYGRNIKKEGWKEPAAVVVSAMSYFEQTVREVSAFTTNLASLTTIPFEIPEDLEKPEDFIRKPMRVLRVSPKYAGSVVDALVPEEPTMFGLYNAVTALGRDSRSRDVKHMFEKAGFRTISCIDDVLTAYEDAQADL